MSNYWIEKKTHITLNGRCYPFTWEGLRQATLDANDGDTIHLPAGQLFVPDNFHEQLICICVAGGRKVSVWGAADYQTIITARGRNE